MRSQHPGAPSLCVMGLGGRYRQRPAGAWLAVGLDGEGRLVELVYQYDEEDGFFLCVPWYDPAEWQDAPRAWIGEARSMNISEYMKKHNLTDVDLDTMAAL